MSDSTVQSTSAKRMFSSFKAAAALTNSGAKAILF